jgi:hypothetical protein
MVGVGAAGLVACVATVFVIGDFFSLFLVSI